MTVGTLTPAQLRAARSMLQLSYREAAQRAGVAHTTISRLEQGDATVQERTAVPVRRMLEAGGVEFLEGGWVRLAADAAE